MIKHKDPETLHCTPITPPSPTSTALVHPPVARDQQLLLIHRCQGLRPDRVNASGQQMVDVTSLHQGTISSPTRPSCPCHGRAKLTSSVRARQRAPALNPGGRRRPSREASWPMSAKRHPRRRETTGNRSMCIRFSVSVSVFLCFPPLLCLPVLSSSCPYHRAAAAASASASAAICRRVFSPKFPCKRSPRGVWPARTHLPPPRV